ncbi:hypothetical protein ACG7TL_005376 [Trametes sanguinea]
MLISVALRPPASATTAPQQEANTTASTDATVVSLHRTIARPLFSGDPNGDNPRQFWKDARVWLSGLPDEEKCSQFDLLLVGGSSAEVWYDSLPKETKNEWRALQAAFEREWYYDNPPLSDAQALEYICQPLPSLDDLLKYDGPPGSRLVPRHIQWARWVYATARSQGFADALAGQVRERLPRPLRSKLPSVSTWKDLRDAVLAVDTTQLREDVIDAFADLRKEKELEDRLASVENQVAELQGFLS